MATGFSRLEILAHLVANSDGALRVVDESDGWPSHVLVSSSDGTVPIALHVAPIGLSHRGRDAVERRFQNPSGNHPVAAAKGELPLLVGLSTEFDPHVAVIVDGTPRLGRATRQSIFVGLETLRIAASSGWAQETSASSEHRIAVHPALLPPLILGMASNSLPNPFSARIAAEASGLIQSGLNERERARRVVASLIRDARFRERVLRAYDDRCAMCGLGLGLVEGAHIIPVASKESTDDVQNGIALCRNHHASFDRHQIRVTPGTWELHIHPELHSAAAVDGASARFVQSTLQCLALPRDENLWPWADCFKSRYAHFDGSYDW